MPKLKVKANELVHTNADFVSLVKRGATRIPFRITKEDGEATMDLYKIGRSLFQKAEAKPEIVAAIVQPGADIASVASLFKAAGLEPKAFTKSEKDGITTVAKDGHEAAVDAAVLQLTDGTALVVSGLKKSFDSYAYNSTDFQAVMSTEGVYPSMCVAKDALGGVISNILYKSNSPGEAADLVATAIDDFKTYMVGLLGAVPVSAFKMDIAVAQAAKPENKVDTQKGDVPAISDEKPVATPEQDQAAHEPAETDSREALAVEMPDPAAAAAQDQAEATQKDEGFGEADPSTETQEATDVVDPAPEGDAAVGETLEEPAAGGDEPAAASEEPAPVAKSDNTDILAAIAALQKSVEASVDEVRNSVGALSQRVDGVAAIARKADEAINGTVFNEAGDDTPVRTLKSETQGAPPLLDTAYTGRAVA